MIAAATCDAETAEALHRFYDIRVREWAPCVQQAIDRGEIPEGTDAQEVIRAVSAPLYYRLPTTDDRLDEAAVDGFRAYRLTEDALGVEVDESRTKDAYEGFLLHTRPDAHPSVIKFDQ